MKSKHPRSKKASAYLSSREVLEAAMKDLRKKPASRKAQPNGANGIHFHNGNGTSHFIHEQEELERAIQRYVELYDFGPIAYVSFDKLGHVEDINFAAARLLQQKRDALIGAPFVRHIHKPDTEIFLHHLLNCRSSRKQTQTKLRLTNPKGEIIPVELSSVLIESSLPAHSPLYQTAILDLSERETAQESLQLSTEHYRTLFEWVPVAIYSCDAQGRILEFNQRAVELWGRKPQTGETAEKFCGSFRIFYPDGRPMRHRDCPMARTLRGEEVPADELKILVERENGARRHVAASPRALRDNQSRIIGAINALFDITEQQQAQALVAESNHQLETLYRFVQRRYEAQSLSDIYSAAIDTILTAIRCDRTAILLLDQKNVMRFVNWHGLSARYRKKGEGHSPWKLTARNPAPLYLENIAQSDLPPSLKATLKAEGIAAAAFIPLMAERKLIGKCVLYYDKSHVFPEEEITLGLNIAGQLALGIERKRAEEALNESEDLHRAFVNQTEIGMARTDVKGRLIFVNKKFCQITGYKESELLGKGIADLTHPDYTAETQKLFRRLVGRGIPYHVEKRYRRKDGSLVWVKVSASPVLDADGETQAVVAIIRDISQRKEAQAQLEEAHAMLEAHARGLEGEILEISDREQQRLGQDLHDSLCQHLTAVAFMTRSIALRLKNHRVLEVDDVDKIAELINEGVTEARTIARGLHPVELESGGLVAALSSLVNQKHWRVPCRLDVNEEILISDPTVALHLYRIAGEAIINANKHARAREITVGLRSRKKGLELSIIDDGKGMKESDINKSTGMGLHIMEYRARSIGARLEIKPIKPRGTRIVCYVPRK